jgi:hypothetical protein
MFLMERCSASAEARSALSAGVTKAHGALRPLRIEHLALAPGDEETVSGQLSEGSESVFGF